MSKRKKLPKGWRSIPISGSAQFINGRGFKRAEWVDQGLPIIRIQNLNDLAKPFNCYDGTYSQDIYIEDGDMLFSWSASLGVFLWDRGPALLNQHIFKVVPHAEVDDSFLYYALQHVLKELKTHGSTMKHITKEVLDKQKIPLPPLAVQERIVEVLQQADAIRCKRAEARCLADQVLPALFLDMFGDPATNPKAWPVEPIGNLVAPEIERVCPAKAFPDEEFTYIEITHIDNIHFRITAPKRLLGKNAPSRARQVVRIGDVLYSMTRPNLRNIAVVPEELDGAIATTGFAILRPKKPQDTAFIFEMVKAPAFTNAMARFAEEKSLYPAVDEPEIRRYEIMTPPHGLRAQFAENYQFLAGLDVSTRQGNDSSGLLFDNLLSRALTGELTAEWEAANEKWITERQAFYKRLPRLALLALLLERCERAGRDAVTLITALMKYTFLAQTEGELRRRLYRFVPYHYGPCAMELYDDLKALAADGLIAVENDAEEDKTRITLIDPDRTAALLEDEAKKDDARLAALEQAEEEADAETDPAMPRLLKRRAETLDALRTDAATILDTYGDLDHTALLKTVYEKYPAYAKKSRAKAKRRRK